MRNLFNYPLGACVAPFGFCKREVLSAGAGAAIAAGIGAASSIGTAAMNNYAADLTSDRQFYRTQDLMQLQKRIDLEKWQKQNEYNTPSAEMQRLKEAGINPYLASREGVVGSGSSQSMPNGSAPSAQLGQFSPVDLSPVTSNIAQLLAVGSQIKRNDAESLSKIVEAITKVGPSLGWSNARSMAKNLLGVYGITNSQSERQLNSIIDGLESEARSKAVKATLDEAFGVRDANQKWSLGEQALSESFARVGKMSSDAKVNEAKINELASSVVRNVADAWKLRKEGKKYVADTKTVNALREFLVSQARSHSQIISNQSFMTGADPLSPIHDFKYSKEHVKSVIGGMSITDEQYSSELIRAMDKVLGEYVKVSNGAASSYNTNNFTNY